ncbi:MAG TPA: hypothetical protein VMF52_20450 [Steroidobacteraceae bacterium]|nr:hypothetical protein [Steroidobacteraceae bacterium]
MRYVPILVLCALPMAPARADDAEAFREIGAVLGWRLAAPTLEANCRVLDPGGAAVRKKSLETWTSKNAALIKSVDDRVAEVVPLLLAGENTAHPVADVEDHVRTMLLESLTPEICKAERDPSRHTWTNNGLPHVQEALAALYDWQMSRAAR